LWWRSGAAALSVLDLLSDDAAAWTRRFRIPFDADSFDADSFDADSFAVDSFDAVAPSPSCGFGTGSR